MARLRKNGLNVTFRLCDTDPQRTLFCTKTTYFDVFLLVHCFLSIDCKHSCYSLSPRPSIDRSVGLSGKYTVAKQLSGSGCHLGGEWDWSRDGCIRWVVIIE